MAIERKIDSLGRICIPKEMRDRIGVEEEIPVSIISNDVEIIIRNTRPMKTREDIKARLSGLEVKNEYDKGVKETLEWVLNGKGEK